MELKSKVEQAETARLKAAAEWVLRLREDSLSDAEMQRWLAWCEADEANLDAFEKAQSLWRSIPPEAGAQLRTAPRADRGRPARVSWKFMGLAASVLVLGTAAVFYVRNANPALGRSAHIEAPRQIDQQSVLPDGSNIALSAGSNVALEFTSTQRQLSIQNGAAFFDVKPDAKRPFTVRAGVVNITAIGTAFNVRHNAERVVVAVQQGVVRLDGPRGKPVQAGAGERLTYDGKSGGITFEREGSAAELAWRKGQLIYNGEPLDVVIENVNRYATRKIELADPSLTRIRFTGTVFTDSIETWLWALPSAFPVTVRHEGDRDVIASVP